MMRFRIPTILKEATRRFSGLTSEQLDFQALAKDFAKTELFPKARQWEAEKQFSVSSLRQAAKLGTQLYRSGSCGSGSIGFAGICVREDVGGCGLGALDAAIVFEALASGDISTTAFLTVQNMVATIIDKHGSDDQRNKYLPSLVSLEKFGSYCLTEPGSGSDAASLITTAKNTEDGLNYILDGSKAFISGGGLSDIYIVMARTGGSGPHGISSFAVQKGSRGLSFGKEEEKMGWISQPTTSVFFDSVSVPSDNLIGGIGNGFSIAMSALDRGRVNIGACSVGGAQFCLEAAEEYVNSRKQFGRLISEFQNTEFVLADMATQIQAARLMVYQAAKSLDIEDPGARLDAAMAKMFATDMAVSVSNKALQLFGGYGYLREYHVERFLRDLRVMTILEGTNEIMKVIIHKERVKSTKR